MHEIESQKYSDAAATLKTLAHNEINKVNVKNQLISRKNDRFHVFFNFFQVSNKKTLLSISKLAMLASDEPPEVAEMELRSIEYDLNIISGKFHPTGWTRNFIPWERVEKPSLLPLRFYVKSIV